MPIASENPSLARPEALLRLPVGMSSPLWGFFAGAAVSGAAWWWWTQWSRPENLEAMFGKAAEADGPVEAMFEAEVVALEARASEPEAEEAAPPPVADIAEAAGQAEAAIEAVIEPPILAAPVGGEAAPVAPALTAGMVEVAAEPAPAPRPRAKKAEPTAD
jgi:hypothetical protein